MTTRAFTYVVDVKTADGKKKLKDFKFTMSGVNQSADQAQKSMASLGDSIGSKLGQKVKVGIDQSNLLKQELQAGARQANRAERNYERLASEYKHLTARTGKTAEQQEKMNALHQLGAGATLTQKKEIIKLVNAQQAQVKANGHTQKSMRGLRGQAQNLGWQLQDVAVQAQMGTDALIIFGQQGSQLASGFGATGALVGAGIAVFSAAFGVLYKAMSNTGDEVKRFKTDIKSLSSSLEDISKLTSSQLSIAYIDLSKRLNQLSEQKGEFGKKLAEINSQLDTGSKKLITYTKSGEAIVNYEKLSIEQKTELIRKYKEEAASLGVVNDEYKNVLKILNDVNAAKNGQQTSTQASNIKDLVKSIESEVSEYGKSERALSLLEAKKGKATKADLKRINSAYDIIEAREAQEKAEEKATKTLAKELAEQQKLQQDHMNALAKYTDEGKLIKLQIQYAKERELLAGNNEALLELDKEYNKDRLAITGTFWEKYAIAAQDKLGSFDEQVANSLDRFSSSFGNAIANAAFESDSLGEAMANIFKDVGKNMVAFFAEWAAQKLMLWALDKLVGTATQTAAATTMTTNASAMSLMAGLNAFTSTAAIPVVGPALAPAAATAAVGATAPMAAAVSSLAFAGVFDKGGKIPSGSAGIVAEYGDELVGGTMVYNGSQGSLNVTGREETARKSGGTMNLGGIVINSNGNASPDAISRSLIRALKKGSKSLDNEIFGSMNRGRKNGGKRFA